MTPVLDRSSRRPLTRAVAAVVKTAKDNGAVPCWLVGRYQDLKDDADAAPDRHRELQRRDSRDDARRDFRVRRRHVRVGDGLPSRALAPIVKRVTTTPARLVISSSPRAGGWGP